MLEKNFMTKGKSLEIWKFPTFLNQKLQQFLILFLCISAGASNFSPSCAHCYDVVLVADEVQINRISIKQKIQIPNPLHLSFLNFHPHSPHLQMYNKLLCHDSTAEMLRFFHKTKALCNSCSENSKHTPL